MKKLNKYKLLTGFFVACFCLSAVYHFVSIFVPNGIPEPTWQHALFVYINALMAFSATKIHHTKVWPNLLAILFACQQLCEHVIWWAAYPDTMAQNLFAILFAVHYGAFAFLKESWSYEAEIG